jgi:hypothetical protein
MTGEQLVQDLIDGARRANNAHVKIAEDNAANFFKAAGAYRAMEDLGLSDMEKEAIWPAVAAAAGRALPWIGRGLKWLGGKAWGGIKSLFSGGGGAAKNVGTTAATSATPALLPKAGEGAQQYAARLPARGA